MLGTLPRDLRHELRDIDRRGPELEALRLRLPERDEVTGKEKERVRLVAQRLDAVRVERPPRLRFVQRVDHLLRRDRQLVLEHL